MKINKLQDRLANFASNWKKIHCHYSHGWEKTRIGRNNNKTPEEIYNELIACNPLTKQDVINIMGHSDWIDVTCSECGKGMDNAVSLCAYSRQMEPWTHICPDCMQKACQLLVEANANAPVKNP